ncbi:hypothetical protein, partial [Parabacteroides distasonis]|uniref:hypothetical protein n=1 Tax=Parabacteroides distasonis TaxID=823 RepID=UPI00195F279B
WRKWSVRISSSESSDRLSAGVRPILTDMPETAVSRAETAGIRQSAEFHSSTENLKRQWLIQ